MKINNFFCLLKKSSLTMIAMIACAEACGADFWKNEKDAIAFYPQKTKDHFDHLEMSGLTASAIIRYGVSSQGLFHLDIRAIFPTFRMRPNVMDSSFMRDFDIDPVKLVNAGVFRAVRDTPNGIDANVKSIKFDGILRVEEELNAKDFRLKISRKIGISPNKPAICQTVEIENVGKTVVNLEIPDIDIVFEPHKDLCEFGQYVMEAKTHNSGGNKLEPQKSVKFSFVISARKKEKPLEIDVEKEILAREDFIKSVNETLVLETPDENLNKMFQFSKIRAAESVFKTKAGLMHCPGGGRYYMGFWANDQAEYANPFFPFLGLENPNEAAFNTFKLFSKYINDAYKMIPSAITAEAKITWNGKGDRGDAAMVAYGAGRYALACGNKEKAKELMPLIDWCLEYCKRNLNADGVVKSDCDELELRFPAGEANLCTSSLYYDALISAAFLKSELGDNSASQNYLSQAKTLHKNIRKYFESEVEGFDTYRYYDGNNILRSWICIPLCMGIFDKSEGTAAALLSPKLLTPEGMLVQTNTRNYWDRTCLYALRGLFAASKTQEAYKLLQSYVQERLLGDHVPYAIEAFPEGGKAHLSAESALFCRIATEGIFGIRPTGFKSFEIKPSFPQDWQEAKLSNIKAFGKTFDISIKRLSPEKIELLVKNSSDKKLFKKTLKNGETAKIKL